MNRKEFKAKLSEVNESYLELKVLLEKRDNAEKNLERLNKIHRGLVSKLRAMSEDDLIKLNNGGKISIT